MIALTDKEKKALKK